MQKEQPEQQSNGDGNGEEEDKPRFGDPGQPAPLTTENPQPEVPEGAGDVPSEVPEEGESGEEAQQQDEESSS